MPRKKTAPVTGPMDLRPKSRKRPAAPASGVFQMDAPYPPAGDQPRAIAQLVQGLQNNNRRQTLLGVTGSGKTFTMASVVAQMNRPAMVIAHNKTLAAQLYAEFRAFFPQNAVEYFVSYYDYYQPEAYVPARDLFIEKDSSVNKHIEQMRLSATKALMERRDALIVATVSAIYGIGDPVDYHSMVLHLKVGETIPRQEIIRRLTNMQYKRVPDFQRGTFRARGDVIDVYPAENAEDAVRIELNEDDAITALFTLDPLTGRKRKRVHRFTVYPSSHYVAPRDTVVRAMSAIKEELAQREKEFRKNGKNAEADRLSQRTLFDLEMLETMGFCKGIENYSRHLSGRNPGEPPPTLFDYLPPDALLFIDESHVTVPQLGGMYRGDRARKETLVQYGFRLPSAMDNRPLKFEEFERLAPPTVFVSATPGKFERENSTCMAEQIVRPTGLLDPTTVIRPVEGQVEDLLGEIKERAARDERILATTLTKRMAEQLTSFLTENGVRAKYLHADIETIERADIIRELRAGEFDALVGINLLREGLDLPEVSLVAILDADKEGFLRSEQSLIQTIGRAARHLRGTAILYADKTTDSMRRALDETGRRRDLQREFNRQHGITPRGVAKAVRALLERPEEAEQEEQIPRRSRRKLTAENVGREIRDLERRMLRCAQNLEFEKAAELRDQIRIVRRQVLGVNA